MGRKKFDAVHRYFTYDPLTQISKCELCGRDLKGCHSSNLKNHMVAHHPEDFAVVKALNVSLKKENSDANNTTTTTTTSTTTITTQDNTNDCKTENTSVNSDDDAEWLDSEFVNCQNSADNNPTSSQIDDHGDYTPTQQHTAASTPKKFKTNNNLSLNASGINRDNDKTESNMIFGKLVAAELGRFHGKERYIVMQKIMRIFME